MKRRGAGLALALAALGAGPAGADGETGRVLFPAGGCTTGWIELQLFDREAATWRSEGRVATGSCRTLRLDQLLNEVRVRCVDGRGEPRSGWVVGISRLLEGAQEGLTCQGDAG